MYAQRNASSGPRSRTGYNRPVPTRLRMGLVMRRDMDFGPLGDMEPALRGEGVSLAPMSTGDASLSASGVTVLPTATVSDITSGAVKGLVVPGGSTDEASMAAVLSLVDAARAKDLPILAFGDAVALVAERLEVSAEAEGAAFHNGKVALMNDRAQLAAVVGAIS